MADKNFDNDYESFMQVGSTDDLDDQLIVDQGKHDRIDGLKEEDNPFDDPAAKALWLKGWRQ